MDEVVYPDILWEKRKDEWVQVNRKEITGNNETPTDFVAYWTKSTGNKKTYFAPVRHDHIGFLINGGCTRRSNK